MKNLHTSILFFVLSALGMTSLVSAQEADDFKVAGVNVQQVFQAYHRTTQTENDVNEERIRIQKSDRQIRSQMKLADKQITEFGKARDLSGLTEEEKAARAETMQALLSRRNKLNDERVSKYEQSNNQLNQDMMTTMAGILGSIQRFVESYSEKSGYDVVFDLSGTSTNQTAPVIGGKGIIDITAAVIAELNKETSTKE